jgi:hypothetical protein
LLVLALILFVLLVNAVNRRRNKAEKVPMNAWALAGLLFGSTGLFFLSRIPYLGQHFLLTHPAFEWPLLFLGAGWFGNPLMFSALPALLLTMLSYPWKKLVPLAFGFSCGQAAFLTLQSFSQTTGIAWVPGTTLEFLWLLGNALLCLILSVVASFRVR